MNRFLAQFVGDVEPQRREEATKPQAKGSPVFSVPPSSSTSAKSSGGAVASPRSQNYLDHLDEIPLSTNSPIPKPKQVSSTKQPFDDSSQSHNESAASLFQSPQQQHPMEPTQYDQCYYQQQAHHPQEQQSGYDGYYGGQTGYDQQYYSSNEQQQQFHSTEASGNHEDASYYYYQQQQHQQQQQYDVGQYDYQPPPQDYASQDAGHLTDQQQQYDGGFPYYSTHETQAPPSGQAPAATAQDAEPQQLTAAANVFDPVQGPFGAQETSFDTLSSGANAFFGSPKVDNVDNAATQAHEQPSPFDFQHDDQHHQQEPFGSFGDSAVESFAQDASDLFGVTSDPFAVNQPSSSSPKPKSEQAQTPQTTGTSSALGFDSHASPQKLQSSPLPSPLPSPSPSKSPTKQGLLEETSPKLLVKEKMSSPSSSLALKSAGTPTKSLPAAAASTPSPKLRQSRTPSPQQSLQELDLTASTPPFSATKATPSLQVGVKATSPSTSPGGSPVRYVRKNSSTALDDATRLMEMYKQMAERLEMEKSQLLNIISSQTDELERMKAKLKALSISQHQPHLFSPTQTKVP